MSVKPDGIDPHNGKPVQQDCDERQLPFVTLVEFYQTLKHTKYMNTPYKVAVEARIYRLLRDVASGSLEPVSATSFLCDELDASFGRGYLVGQRDGRDKKTPRQGRSASHKRIVS